MRLVGLDTNAMPETCKSLNEMSKERLKPKNKEWKGYTRILTKSILRFTNQVNLLFYTSEEKEKKKKMEK